MAKGPVLIELDEDVTFGVDVNTVLSLPDPVAPVVQGRAMQNAAKMMARKPSFFA